MDQQKIYVCGHCDSPLSKTLYFKHKKLFYDPHMKVWKNKRIPPPVSIEEEFIFSASQSPEDECRSVDHASGDDLGMILSIIIIATQFN